MLQEYMALKRYISEKQLPARFQVVGGVGSWERPPPLHPPPPRPGPATSYQELGRFPPAATRPPPPTTAATPGSLPRSTGRACTGTTPSTCNVMLMPLVLYIHR